MRVLHKFALICGASGKMLAQSAQLERAGMDSSLGNGKRVGEVMEGIASIALLPCGSISGHFIRIPDSICYGLFGTELASERECSRGEDYRLIKLSIIDYSSKKEQVVVVECRGQDAAWFQNIDHAHGWEKDVVDMVEQEHGKQTISVSFECETLKSENAAEEHIRKYMPNLAGLDAVVNVGQMSISGLNFQQDVNQEERTEDSGVNVDEVGVSGLNFKDNEDREEMIEDF